jgi:sulfite exporter TauE/SafE
MSHCIPLESFTLLAAFLAGLAGSVHCLAMCGGISGALGVRARGQGAGPLNVALQCATHQLGRLTSYALAGAMIGSAAGFVPALLHNDELILAMRALAGLVLVGAAIGVLSTWRPLAQLERMGATCWRHLAPLSRSLPANRPAGQFLLGMLWGWLPCGMVYSMLMVAALSGAAGRGAATMLCFGLGTVPAVFSAGVASAQVLRVNRARGVKTALGSLLLVFGVATALAPWTLR